MVLEKTQYFMTLEQTHINKIVIRMKKSATTIKISIVH